MLFFQPLYPLYIIFWQGKTFYFTMFADFHFGCPYIYDLCTLCRIKNDDKMIQAEGGVDALSEEQLREDCRERGMLGLRSVEEMRQQVHLCHFLEKGYLICSY